MRYVARIAYQAADAQIRGYLTYVGRRRAWGEGARPEIRFGAVQDEMFLNIHGLFIDCKPECLSCLFPLPAYFFSTS